MRAVAACSSAKPSDLATLQRPHLEQRQTALRAIPSPTSPSECERIAARAEYPLRARQLRAARPMHAHDPVAVASGRAAPSRSRPRRNRGGRRGPTRAGTRRCRPRRRSSWADPACRRRVMRATRASHCPTACRGDPKRGKPAACRPATGAGWHRNRGPRHLGDLSALPERAMATSTLRGGAWRRRLLPCMDFGNRDQPLTRVHRGAKSANRVPGASVIRCGCAPGLERVDLLVLVVDEIDRVARDQELAAAVLVHPRAG